MQATCWRTGRQAWSFLRHFLRIDRRFNTSRRHHHGVSSNQVGPLNFKSSPDLDITVQHREQLLAAVHANRWNAALLQRLPALQLADCWLTGGCVAQSLWNVQVGRVAECDIVDYDVFYYDEDLSWEAEDAVIQRVARLCVDLPVEIQIRNQARVPLWYRDKFGIDYGRVDQACDGIKRFPCASVAVGVQIALTDSAVFAPFGLQDLFDGVLKPNPALPIATVYQAKVARWRAIWPHLRVEPWPAIEIGPRPHN